MGRRLGTVIAGLAVIALVIIGIVALAAQSGEASAQAGVQAGGAPAAVQAGSAVPDCGECAGQDQAPGSGAIQGCEGCGVQTPAPAAGDSVSGDCCPY